MAELNSGQQYILNEMQSRIDALRSVGNESAARSLEDTRDGLRGGWTSGDSTIGSQWDPTPAPDLPINPPWSGSGNFINSSTQTPTGAIQAPKTTLPPAPLDMTDYYSGHISAANPVRTGAVLPPVAGDLTFEQIKNSPPLSNPTPPVIPDLDGRLPAERGRTSRGRRGVALSASATPTPADKDRVRRAMAERLRTPEARAMLAGRSAITANEARLRALNPRAPFTQAAWGRQSPNWNPNTGAGGMAPASGGPNYDYIRAPSPISGQRLAYENNSGRMFQVDSNTNLHSSGAVPPTSNSATTSSSSKIMCTHFRDKGWLSKEIWLGEQRFALNHLSQETRSGYLMWATPIVRGWERGNRLSERVWWPIVRAWANEAAAEAGEPTAKSTLFGKAARAILEPFSRLVWSIRHAL